MPDVAVDGEATAQTPLADETIDFDHRSQPLADTTMPAESLGAGSGSGGRSGSGRRIEAGQLIGQYRTLHPLGEGGMGVVWAAEDQATGRRVALKVMSPALAGNTATVERFVREGQLAAKLSHPRSTFVFDAGEQDGCPYIAMELMPGRTLDDLVKEEGQLSVQRATDLILDVIDGLQAAHAMGIIHRDVKPSNCFLDGEGRAKVGDYGLSKSLVTDASLTRTGAFMGTPLYAAPEQVRGAEVDERTDVYAVGATLFYLLGGQGPFDGDAMAVIAKIVSDPPTKLRSVRADAPISLERVISRTLEKDPARRFQTLGELRGALLPFASGGTSIAALGRRMAAYMIDTFIASSLGFIAIVHFQLVDMIGKFMRNEVTAFAPSQQNQSQIGLLVVTQILLTAYFVIGEGRWGCCVGKWAMGLRVSTMQGEVPGYGRAFIRVLFIPSAMGFNIIWPIVATVMFSDRGEEAFQLTLSLISGSLNWLIILIFLSTMRTKNGYRAMHDFASGTRVVRWKSGEAEIRLEAPIVLAKASESPEQYGPYTALGDVGTDHQGDRFVLANDQMLHREVWIRLRGEKSKVDRSAPPPARRTRPYFLQAGEWESGTWEAYEAIEGAPLTWIARSPDLIDWAAARRILLDLTTELIAMRDEESLPDRISVNQLWVDRKGQLRYLESPIRLAGAQDPFTKAEADSNPHSLPPLDLLKHCAALLTGDKVLPTPARAFVDELSCREDADVLDWAASELAELTTHRDRLRWDDRLVMLGASMATEFTFYVVTSMALAPLFAMFVASGFLQGMILIGLLTCVAFALGAVFRGGPIFKLTGVELLDRNGNPAGPLRAGLRNAIVWFPFIVFYSLCAMALVTMMNSGGDPRLFAEGASGLLLGLVAGECLFLFFILGGLYALVRPQRGLQDLIVGTQLTPKR